MKWNQFIAGLFIGCSVGLMLGAAFVHLPEGVRGDRDYPLFWCMLLAILGAVALRSGILPGRSRSAGDAPGKVE
jgi:hypothetical protein